MEKQNSMEANFNKQDFQKLIEKYLDGNASLDEIELLNNYCYSFQQDNAWEEFNPESGFRDRMLENILEAIKEEDKPQKIKVLKIFRSNAFKFSAAAAVLLFIFFNALYKTNTFKKVQVPVEKVVLNNIKIGTDKAILTLEDGSEVALEKDRNYKNNNVSSNGREIVYGQGDNEEKENLFNYLTIPRGGQYSIKLADGTQVWLNSESKLKFPVSFVKGESRDVELLYGEAYFEVSPSSKHQGTHFFVHNKKQQVEVVGTQFNIKAYPDENNIFTTLVEGKVTVSTDQQTKKLMPGEQSQLNLKNKGFKISHVDVSRSIAWKEGVFYFEDESIENILRTMSRWYDFEYKFKSENLKDSRFTGIIKKRKNLEDILNIISRTSNIKYSINSKNNVNEVIISSK